MFPGSASFPILMNRISQEGLEGTFHPRMNWLKMLWSKIRVQGDCDLTKHTFRPPVLRTQFITCLIGYNGEVMAGYERAVQGQHHDVLLWIPAALVPH